MSRAFSGSRALMAMVKEAGSKTMKSPLTLKSSTTATGEAVAEEKSKRLRGIQKMILVFLVMKEFLGGVAEITRVKAVKKIWEHIKLNGLQNSANKREFFCDKKLKDLFEGKDKV